MSSEVLDKADASARAGVELDSDDDDDDGSGDDSLGLDEDDDRPNLIPESQPRILAGRIELIEKIGEGGMGSVWRGHHLKLDRPVAVKILDETLQLRVDGRERFLREARALALLEHPNVVRVHDCDELPDGRLYLCMDLLDGDTLRDIIERRKPVEPLVVIDIGLQVCDAVSTAHEHGILHRDLKPANIIRLRDPAGTIKVIDWGLCKYLDLFYARSTQKYAAPPGARLVTPFGCRFGTPGYIAPELILRENPGAPNFSTDLYALAVVLYELLTGHYPFARGDRQQPRPVRSFLPDFEANELEGALRHALCFEVEERTPSLAKFREDLELARDCLLAEPAGLETESPSTAPEVDRPVASVVAPASLHAPAPRRPLFAVGLPVLLGVVLGTAGTSAANQVWVRELSNVRSARLEQETARADAAEAGLARCTADRSPVSRPVKTPLAEPQDLLANPGEEPPAQPSPALELVAASTAERLNPDLSRAKTARPLAPAPRSFTEGMARLEPKVRACARKAGMPERATTVQVRHKDGVLDLVKVLKLSKEHGFSQCVDQLVRRAELPPGANPIEEFTFFD